MKPCLTTGGPDGNDLWYRVEATPWALSGTTPFAPFTRQERNVHADRWDIVIWAALLACGTLLLLRVAESWAASLWGLLVALIALVLVRAIRRSDSATRARP